MSDTAILVEGLAKRFGDVVALDGIDFRVPAGTVFGLLGPNGAGKTTAIRVLATILRPDAGRAEVLGHDVVREADEVRHRIGLAGQYAAVDPNLTGRENLRLTGRLAQLVFASSVFIPVETMPDWLQPFAEHQPVSVTASAVRALVIGGPTTSYVLQCLAWVVAILVVFAPIAVWRYRRAE
jgi:ABC-type uncharacterized transport system ATPase subunit